MSWREAVILWAPTAAVVFVAALALTLAGSPPATRGGRRAWVLVVFVASALAIGGTVWQSLGQRLSAGRVTVAAAAIHNLSAQLSRIGGDTVAVPNRLIAEATEKLGALAGRNEKLEKRVTALESNARVIPDAKATQLADYLRPFGSRRVVVSCVPGDVEAYNYATQIVDVLKSANWDAQGPETTAIFGEAPAVGINLYANNANASDTPKILVAAFEKFGIAYQGRISPSDAIPDHETVELYIGPQPQQATSGSSR
jgi:cell division protein FtsB